MKPTLINIKERERNTEYYDRTRDMETAIAWNSVKKTLTLNKRELLFEYIKSIRLTEKNIIISTEKPIVNSELKIYTKDILTHFNTTIQSIGGKKRENIRTQ